MLLLQSTSNLLETRRENGYSTSLRKIRAPTHIRGNNLADAAAKLAVTDFDTLPEDQQRGLNLGQSPLDPHSGSCTWSTPLHLHRP